MKVADKTCPWPADKTVPAGGEYVNEPGTEALASSCALPSAVPALISAGMAQVMVGVALVTVSVVVVLAAAKLVLAAKLYEIV